MKQIMTNDTNELECKTISYLSFLVLVLLSANVEPFSVSRMGDSCGNGNTRYAGTLKI